LDWIELAQDKDNWRAAMNTVFTYRVSNKCVVFLDQLRTVNDSREALHYAHLGTYWFRFPRTWMKAQVVASPLTCTAPHKHINVVILFNEYEVHCAE
jgi:hypothetical protein